MQQPPRQRALWLDHLVNRLDSVQRHRQLLPVGKADTQANDRSRLPTADIGTADKRRRAPDVHRVLQFAAEVPRRTHSLARLQPDSHAETPYRSTSRALSTGLL
jgi:hypothetical protein